MGFGAAFGATAIFNQLKSTVSAASAQEQIFKKLKTAIDITGESYNSLEGEI